MTNAVNIKKLSNNNDFIVSISYVTFNHEKFVKRALDSFLCQETNFKFEILITDDASSDKTIEILKQYEKTHSDIIKVNFNIKNQFRINGQPHQANFRLARGSYIALCDGDDYWIDKFKLKKQIDLMLKMDLNVSFHSVKITNPYNNRSLIKRPSEINKVYSVNEIIWYGHSLYTSVVSTVIKAEIAKKLPDFYKTAPTEDHYLLIFGSLDKDALFISDCMACYEFQSENSWHTNPNLSQHHLNNLKTFINLFLFLKNNKFKTKVLIILKIIKLFFKYLILKSSFINKFIAKKNIKSLIS